MATTILLDYLITVHRPDVATVWFSGPDGAQHNSGVGSQVALEGIRLAYNLLGRIMDRLGAEDFYEPVDILVLSDDGHSTVSEVIDVCKLIAEAGIRQSKESTEVLVADDGGCVSIYVPGHDPGKVSEVVEFLMSQPWCGSIFTRLTDDGLPGTIPLCLIDCCNDGAPDVLMSFGWSSEANANWVRGSAPSSGDLPVGRGNHGSLSPFEIHNTLVAAGPHFKHGATSIVPLGNVDVFPAVLNMLGLEVPQVIDGRILSEVFVSTELHRASADVDGVIYQQEVQLSRVGQTSYLDKGRVLR